MDLRRPSNYNLKDLKNELNNINLKNIFKLKEKFSDYYA